MEQILSNIFNLNKNLVRRELGGEISVLFWKLTNSMEQSPSRERKHSKTQSIQLRSSVYSATCFGPCGLSSVLKTM